MKMAHVNEKENYLNFESFEKKNNNRKMVYLITISIIGQKKIK